MKRFIQGEHRGQGTLLPESLDDYVSDTNPVRVVDELNLVSLGFDGAIPADTGRPAYHPAVLLKIYIYGYLNRIQSSRRLEREAQRNVELMWLTGRLTPDFKTTANFRKDNSKAIRGVCRQFAVLCQQLGLFVENLVAIDGSKFKAVNNRDRNFTSANLKRRMEDIESSISRYLAALNAADRYEPNSAKTNAARLEEKIAKLKTQMKALQAIEIQLNESPDKQLHRPVESTADCSQSGAIITASVILMNSSFLSMASRAPRFVGDLFGINQAREPTQQCSEVPGKRFLLLAPISREAVTKAVTKLGMKPQKQKRPTFR